VFLSLFGVGCFWGIKNCGSLVENQKHIIVVDKEKECFLLLSLLEKGRRVESEREEKRTEHYNLSLS
jgi:hypothetical protein